MGALKNIEHKVKGTVFSIFGPILKKGQREIPAIDANKIARVLFIRPEKLGDTIISFPVFDGLKKCFPHIEISLLASRRNQAIVKNDPRFKNIFIYSKNIFKDIGQIMKIRREKYDCVIDMVCDDSVTALFLTQICAPGKPRVGVGKVKFKEYYDFNYDPQWGKQGHIIDNTLKLLEAFGIDSRKISGYATPFIDSKSDSVGTEFIQSVYGHDRIHLRIGYNLSAGNETRHWPEGNTIALLNKIISHNIPNRIILLTTPDDHNKGKRLAENLNGSVIPLPRGLNIIEISAIIKHLDLLISPDTSLVHIARSFGVRVIGLYTKHRRNFLHWHPYDQSGGVVISNNDFDIHDITVDQVWMTFLESMKIMETARKA